MSVVFSVYPASRKPMLLQNNQRCKTVVGWAGVEGEFGGGGIGGWWLEGGGEEGDAGRWGRDGDGSGGGKVEGGCSAP